MSEVGRHDPLHHVGHDEQHHEVEPWVERNWAWLVIGFGLICVYFLDTFAPVI